MECVLDQADTTQRKVAAEQVAALLERFPLLLDLGETRTVDQILEDMITAKVFETKANQP